MAYVNQYALALDSVFQQKVFVAMVTAAIAVQAEIPATANHTNRSNYAKLVLNNPAFYVVSFSQSVVCNVAITGASIDSDIQFAVNANFSALAGMI